MSINLSLLLSPSFIFLLFFPFLQLYVCLFLSFHISLHSAHPISLYQSICLSLSISASSSFCISFNLVPLLGTANDSALRELFLFMSYCCSGTAISKYNSRFKIKATGMLDTYMNPFDARFRLENVSFAVGSRKIDQVCPKPPRSLLLAEVLPPLLHRLDHRVGLAADDRQLPRRRRVDEERRRRRL